MDRLPPKREKTIKEGPQSNAEHQLDFAKALTSRLNVSGSSIMGLRPLSWNTTSFAWGMVFFMNSRFAAVVMLLHSP
jgi:hypothetical protein